MTKIKRPEAKIQKIVQEVLRNLNLWPYHVPDEKLRYQKVERGVRPDIIAISPTAPTALIEVKVMVEHKTIPQNFRLDSISTGQRNMLDYRAKSYPSPQHAYIAIGTNFVPATRSWNGNRHNSKVWIIPWLSWVTFEYLHCTNITQWVNETQINEYFANTPYKLIRHNLQYSLTDNHPIVSLRSAEPKYNYKKDKLKWQISYRTVNK